MTSMRADEEQMDAASLAALTEFLRECETPVEVHNASVGPFAAVLATQQPDAAQARVGPAAAERRRKVKNAQAAKRRLRYLKKLATERKTLKTQEVELSAQLKGLQQTHAEEKTARNKKTLALSAWRATATRQKERRLESEDKQRRLKAAVANQSALIHRLSLLVQQQRLLSSLESGEQQAAARGRKGKALLKTFVREMDAHYAKTDDVINKADFEMSPPLTYELTRKWSPDKSFLESADATVIPFSFEQTCRAVSLMILAPSYNDELEDPDNTAVRTYRLNFSRELGNSATLVVYNAVKRYVEKDRAVFVWRALAEGQGEFDGLHTVETAWFVVRPLTAADEAEARATNGRAMILESYTRLVPVGFGRPSDNDARANKFIKILAKADEADVNDMKQMLGKLLLDEARANTGKTVPPVSG
ncbi:hypothetical protein PF005_g5733 [Phytophthora fragariae]|uniref:Uncharacterized protein n=2 Tax=Phytophthora fragariae TaxID=53985 RepID=A0A6A3T4U8_9STRA|nr:hypothetical protein PF003_g31529 [Phytophthora fragariae]KAE9126750.1 hypothetical protein PF007_g5860 [Phytophthora fragariae]KAE9224917.1 hypothetical protein PF005_g5733 [Phytophthora fragariae]